MDTELKQFTGTENYYKHYSEKITYTDGIKYMAEKFGAYWLIDLIAFRQPTIPNIKDKSFQVWTLKKTAEGYRVYAENGNGNYLTGQNLPFTDFPKEEMPFKMYVIDNILMLPTEY